MASNRFAALSPDFEEEEAVRKQQAEAQKKKLEAAKLKMEEKPKARPEREGQAPQGERRYPGERGRGRGIRRPYRGRGGFPRGGDVEYVSREKTEFPREQKEFRFTGNTDAVHPFDRHSGTGRGTEVPKRGAGRGNWGNPAEDWKHERNEEEKPEAEEKAAVQEGTEPAKEGEVKKEGEEKHLSKRDKKKLKKEGHKEDKEEEALDADGSALTFQEYQAKIAEKQKGLPSKKAELQISRDPKSASGLVAYAKPQYSNLSEAAKAGKKKVAEEPKTEEPKESAAKTEVLGAYIADEYTRGPRRIDRKFEPKPAEETAAAPAEGERRQPYRRGGYKGPRPAEEKKPEHATPFQMKDEEFPAFK